MLFNTLYFVSFPAEQVKPKNDFPEAISVCLGQALISNPGYFPNFVCWNQKLISRADNSTIKCL